uniref:Putative conserved secreted protein n=1 Tax=Ixodes ricinus TaxID=34613 RepID=A0A6B0UZB7_IXORI
MRHFLGILCIAIRLSLCGACSSEPEPTVKFLGDSEWENIEKNVKLIDMVGYVDPSMKHISSKCKKQLEERMKSRCSRRASGADLKPAEFRGCNFTCRGTQQDGKVTVEQHVALRNGTPCGPHGERCYKGICVARGLETICSVNFVPYVLSEPGYKEPTKICKEGNCLLQPSR